MMVAVRNKIIMEKGPITPAKRRKIDNRTNAERVAYMTNKIYGGVIEDDNDTKEEQVDNNKSM
jgi:hypothetical protein